MNYEQKYKEALETVQEILSSGADAIRIKTLKLRLQSVFPELNESYGEEIRKELIEHIKANYEADYVLFKKFSPDDVIDWLEKQGQTFTKKDVDDAYLKGVCDTKQELEKQTWKPNAAQLIVIKSLIEDKNTLNVSKVILRGMLDEFKQYFGL